MAEPGHGEPRHPAATQRINATCRPGRASLRYWRVDGWITAVIVLVLIGAACAALWTWAGEILFLAAAPGAAACLVYAFAMPRLRMAVHRWSLSEDAITSEYGWLTRRRRITVFSRIQSIDTKQGALQRRCGVLDLVITTASSAGAVVVPAVDEALALTAEEVIRSRLTAETGDGT